jgi:flagellin
MKELAVQKANETLSAEDQANIEEELDQLSEEINNISDTSKFNGIKLFSQINIATSDSDAATFEIGIEALNIEVASDSTIEEIETAIDSVNTARASLGAQQNRLEHIYNNINTTTENLQAAEARIRDTDMALEMVEFTKNNILQQAAQAMLAQANQVPQGVLQLLR